MFPLFCIIPEPHIIQNDTMNSSDEKDLDITTNDIIHLKT